MSGCRITGLKCGAHSIDLIIKDIVAMPWAKATVAAAKKCIKFIKHHQKSLAVFKDKSNGRGLLLPNDTRFGTSFIMIERFFSVSSCLCRSLLACLGSFFTTQEKSKTLAILGT